MSLRGWFERSKVNPNADERDGWSIFGWKFGRYYEGRVRTSEQDEALMSGERDRAMKEVFAEERQLKQEAIRMVSREKDDEVVEVYWGGNIGANRIVDEWARAGYDWSQVAPFRLPKQSDEWKWWNGQDTVGLVALALQNDQDPVVFGAGSNVLVVTDHNRIQTQLQRRLWGHIGTMNTRELMDRAGGGGFFNMITTAEFDSWVHDPNRVDLLGRFHHVIVGATRDLDTPTRLAREWCQVSGWRSGLVDRVAEAWLGVSDHEKLALDLTSLQNYWLSV